MHYCLFIDLMCFPTAPLGVLVGDRVTVTEGEAVELMCGGVGSGVNVEWRRASGSPLSERGVVTTTFNSGQLMVKFLLPQVSLVDEDNYICIASSPYFDYILDATVSVTVLGKPHPLPVT